MLGKVRNKLGKNFKSRWLYLGRINLSPIRRVMYAGQSSHYLTHSHCIWQCLHNLFWTYEASNVIQPKETLISYLKRILRWQVVQTSPSGSSRSKKNVSNGKKREKLVLHKDRTFALLCIKESEQELLLLSGFGLSNTPVKSLTLAEKVGISSDVSQAHI